MRLKKYFAVFALAAVMGFGAALFVSQSASPKQVKQARATTDIGEIAVSEVRNAISTDSNIYLLPTQNYELPDSWDHAYTGVGEEDGIFINGVKQAGALKYAGTGSAYITFHYALPSAATEGDVVEFKGAFASATSGYSFTMNYSTQRLGDKWVQVLENYDIVSLADANMPDFVNISSLETSQSEYAYVTDPAGLPKQKGFFGLTNSTGSYAFQFNMTKSVQGGGWFNIMIGGSGTLRSSGHFLEFRFLDNWAVSGHAYVFEMSGNGDNWNSDIIQRTPEDSPIPLAFKEIGQENTIELGAIKVKNSNTHYVYIKTNGIINWGEYWTLAEAGMTTKVCMQYNGNGSPSISLTNSIEPASVRLTYSSYVPEARQLYLNMENDICPAVNNWDDYFKSVDGDGLKLNGSSVGADKWNYFKKTGAAQMFLALGDIGITPVSGDILYVGGIFKAARTVNGVKVLFKVNFAESYFEFNGTEWHRFNPNYEAADFAKDLLKLTRTICAESSENNHDALVTVWGTLADADHFDSLAIDEKDNLISGVRDETIVVPATEQGIEEMLPEEAIGAALYRYDYCTVKYSLTNFITGRSTAGAYVPGSLPVLQATVNESSTIAIVVISLVGLTAACFILFRKRKHQ